MQLLVLGQTNDGFDHRPVVAVVIGILDEHAVDFQRVHLETLQVSEARQAAAEIVKRQFAADLSAELDEAERHVELGDGAAFGDLEADPLRLDAILAEDELDIFLETGIGERQAGKVDVQARRAQPLGLPGGDPGTGGVDHPAIDQRHHAVALGGRNEAAGRDDAAIVAMHANQHFGIRLDAVVQRHDTLTVKQQPVARQGVRNLRQREEIRLALAEVLIVRDEDLGTIAAALLGGVTGGIGGDQQVGATGDLRRGDGDADTGADPEGTPFPDKRQGPDVVDDVLGTALGFIELDAGQDHAEFVAAQAGQEAEREARLHEACQMLQEGVTSRVTTAVVDHLELVEVDVKNNQRPAGRAEGGQFAGQLVFEGAAIVQSGQRIVRRCVKQFFVGTVLQRDVADTRPITEALALVAEDRLPGHRYPQAAAVAGQHPELEILSGPPGQRLFLVAAQQVAVGGMHQWQREIRHRHAIAYGVAGHPLDRRIYPAQVTIRTEPALPAIGIVGDGAETLFALGELSNPLLDAGRHGIEAAADGRDFIVAVERHPNRVIALADPLAGVGQRREATGQPVAGKQQQQEGEAQFDQGDADALLEQRCPGIAQEVRGKSVVHAPVIRPLVFDRESDMDDLAAGTEGRRLGQGLGRIPADGDQHLPLVVGDREIADILGPFPALENVAQGRIVAGGQRHRQCRLVGQLDGLDADFGLVRQVLADQAGTVADQDRQHHGHDQQADKEQAKAQGSFEGQRHQRRSSIRR
nr:hypothetical protein [Dechloromonas sp. A34]